MQPNKYILPSAVTGALLLMLLRICDRADLLSAVLVTAGLTALLYSLRHASGKSEYLLLAAFMAVTFAVRFYGYTGDPAADLLLGPLAGLIFLALMRVEGLAARFMDNFLYTLIFPLTYLLFLYFTETVKINMPFRLDPYLSCLTLLCQITALLGIYSLDFLLAWTASLLVFLIDHRVSRKSLRSAMIYGLVLCGVICFGLVHRNQMNEQENAKTDTVRVAYVTGPYIGTLSDESYDTLTLEETLNAFTKAVADAYEEGAEILVFSEEAYSILDTNEEVLLEEAKKQAAENHMHLLLAYEVEDTDDSESGKGINKLCWISDEGEILYDYIKNCLVPIVETSEYVRGKEPIKSFDIQINGQTLKVAAAICYDSDFDLYMSHMGKNVDLLLLPTWDWDVIAEEHFGVARLRAISNETTLVRSVYDGWSAVIDSSGKVLARDNTNDAGYGSVLTCDIPVKFHD